MLALYRCGLQADALAVQRELDAPPAAAGVRRHVVRLTRVEASVDELHDLPILEIDWAHEDAQPPPALLPGRPPGAGRPRRAPPCFASRDFRRSGLTRSKAELMLFLRNTLQLAATGQQCSAC